MADDELKIQTPWFPIAKDARKLFPIDRPFSEFEALASLQLDHNNGNPVSVAGYAKLWGWSRGKVRHFLKRAGLCIEYPEDASQIKKRWGRLTVGLMGTRSTTTKQPLRGHIKFINFNTLDTRFFLFN